MALSRGLSLYIYPAAVQATPPVGLHDYRDVASDLKFLTVSPGGFGQLTVTLNLTAKHLSRPELQLFARVALMGLGAPVFLGEISDIQQTGDGQSETVGLTVLGIGNCLRDDAASFSYSAKTAKQVVDDQFNGVGASRQNHNYPMTFDQSQVFADNPGTTYTLSYATRTIEEIINDITTLAGGYVWGVWDDHYIRDSMTFPQGRLYAHTKDTTTTSYIATLLRREVVSYTVTQSGDRAYNIAQVGYAEPSSGTGYATATDSRLAGSGAMNNAPFRRRKYIRDLTGNSAATSANAQVVANAALAQYKNGGNKVDLTLAAVRSNNDVAIPLWSVRADNNIYVPDLSGRGQTAPTGPVATVNQFYIIQTEYSESGSSAELRLTCDNYAPDSEIVLARLQLLAERMARTGSKTTEAVQAIGAALKQWANTSGVASAGSQTYSLQGTTFRPILYQAPTSISWAAATYQTNNSGSPSVNNLNQFGFNGFITSTAGGAISYGGAYTTVGNCIYDLDLKRGVFTHHHGVCGLRREGLSIKEHLVVRRDASGASMQVECPCGGGESYNLDLGLLRERQGAQTDGGVVYHNSDHDAEQARNIRALMRHPAVDLHHLVRDCDCAICLNGLKGLKGLNGLKGRDGREGRTR